MHNLLLKIFTSSGLAEAALRLFTRNRRFALNFHGVSSRRYPEIKNDLQPHHSAAEFHQTLLWISQRFNFLSVEDFLTSSKPGVLLTFDDGHANNLTNIMPILAEFQAQGLFFVATQHVINPRNWLDFTCKNAAIGWSRKEIVPDEFARDCYDGLSEQDLIQLSQSRWAVIGAHTVSHPSLPECSPAQIQMEVTESRAYLQKISRQVVDYFAYPFGHYNRMAANLVDGAGYRAAFVVDPIPVGLPAFEIPRIGIYDSTPHYLAAKLSGLHRPAMRGKVIGGM